MKGGGEIGLGRRRRRSIGTVGVVVLLILMMLMATEMGGVVVITACPSYDNGSGCSKCLANRFKNSCPACVPIMRCMARCLWRGTSRNLCVKKCDCNSDYPKLLDCKKCLSQCKCSCSSA
ncbi:OLC1v1020818C1 [Oldenlandia corymbosa var. corymbosa]|uniref:OLC1v1020818C1 n=1 Tax=Oldenlandia corymbosa var. corymbosa TaxID=529605 RepID=A0AAV1BWJ8_OLDCO|nr:OLC1v1020818C1 [Oldenlandia corymbosa var. corymbosa]